MTRPFRRGAFSRVGLVVGEAMAPDTVTPQSLQARVQALLDSDAVGLGDRARFATAAASHTA